MKIVTAVDSFKGTMTQGICKSKAETYYSKGVGFP